MNFLDISVNLWKSQFQMSEISKDFHFHQVCTEQGWKCVNLQACDWSAGSSPELSLIKANFVLISKSEEISNKVSEKSVSKLS